MKVGLGDIFALVAIVFVVWWFAEQRPVMIYPAIDEYTYTPAKPGGVGVVSGTVEKLRGDCDVRVSPSDLVLVDANGGVFVINQRSGLRLRLPKGRHEVNIKFEVPRFAAPGAATVSLQQIYDCWPFPITQHSPAYKFEVLGQ